MAQHISGQRAPGSSSEPGSSRALPAARPFSAPGGAAPEPAPLPLGRLLARTELAPGETDAQPQSGQAQSRAVRFATRVESLLASSKPPQVLQLTCNKGHSHHEEGPCPDDADDRFKPQPKDAQKKKQGRRKERPKNVWSDWQQERVEKAAKAEENERREREQALLRRQEEQRQEEEQRAREKEEQAARVTIEDATGKSPLTMVQSALRQRLSAQKVDDKRFERQARIERHEAFLANQRAGLSPQQEETMRADRDAAQQRREREQRQQDVQGHLDKLSRKIETGDGGTISGQKDHVNYGHSFPAHMKDELITAWEGRGAGHRVYRGHEQEEGKYYTNFIKDKESIQHNVHVRWTR